MICSADLQSCSFLLGHLQILFHWVSSPQQRGDQYHKVIFCGAATSAEQFCLCVRRISRNPHSWRCGKSGPLIRHKQWSKQPSVLSKCKFYVYLQVIPPATAAMAPRPPDLQYAAAEVQPHMPIKPTTHHNNGMTVVWGPNNVAWGSLCGACYSGIWCPMMVPSASGAKYTLPGVVEHCGRRKRGK